MKIRIKASVKPTEDKEKVIRAIKNIFDGELVVSEVQEGYYIIEGYSNRKESLDKLYNAIRVEQIIAAARSILKKKTYRNKIKLLLHKQAAYAGKISFIDNERESPLGAIYLEIEAEEPDEIIDWLAPEIKTRRSKKKSSRKQRSVRKQNLRKTFK